MSGFAFLMVFAMLTAAFAASDIGQFVAEHNSASTSYNAQLGEYGRVSDYRHTNISVVRLTYSSGNGSVYVENSGGVVLDPDYAGMVLDDEWFAEDRLQRSMSNEWWEPGEVLVINFTQSLGGGLHKLKVTTGNGVYAVLRFYLPVGGAMMSYYDESWARQVPRFRTWNGSTWSNESGAGAVDGSTNLDIQWNVLRAAPTRDEYLLGTLDSNGDVNVQVWQNGSWLGVLEVEDAIVTDERRGFDIAYEGQSGRAVVVYQDNTPLPKYRVWDGRQWSSEGSVGTVGRGTVRWIVLASHPFSDEIVLATLDANRDIYAQVRDGSSWGNIVSLWNDTASRDFQCFDIAYEHGSGQALVVYADRSPVPKYWIWNGTWTGQFSANSVGSNRVRWLRLASDPSSDRLLMGTLDDNEDVNVEVWDGSSWGEVNETDKRVERSNRRVFDVAFENSGDVAMLVLGDRDDSSPDYYTCSTWACDAVDWVAAGDAADVGNDIDWIVLEPDPFSNDIMMMVKDKGGDISVQRWDTASWVVDPGAAMGAGGEVEGDSKNNFESFAIAYALFTDMVL